MRNLIHSIPYALLATAACARDIPANVQSFYDRVKNGECTGGTVLQDGLYGTDPPTGSTFAYCQDDATGVIYLHGAATSDLADMDIDCDGDQSDAGDGRCGNSGDTQSMTAFQDQVQQYSDGAVSDLNANFIPYVVFGNDGSKDGYVNFDPQQYGLEPLSVMAVICGNQLLYGVWGDTNGDDGPSVVGEASISIATACFGTDITGDNGHVENDVLYIAFPGAVEDTVNQDADWGAKSFDDFESSIETLGDQLVGKLS